MKFSNFDHYGKKTKMKILMLVFGEGCMLIRGVYADSKLLEEIEVGLPNNVGKFCFQNKNWKYF